MKTHVTDRKTQFQRCLRTLNDFIKNGDADKTLAIFAGDLNIRDDEV